MTAPRIISQPRPGWFKLRIAKDAPWLPARIDQDCFCTVNGGDDQDVHPWQMSCDRYPHLRAVIDGREVSIARIWMSAREIEKSEYDYLFASLAYDRAKDPLAGRPDQPVNLERIDPARFRP